MNLVSLFSGCGGMDLGFLGDFESLGIHYPDQGFKVIWANEKNKSACETYTSNLGPIECGDIWDLVEDIPQCDVLCGGFPCQDVSTDGGRKGVGTSTRTGLYRAMLRAVEVGRPEVFIAENVKGLLVSFGNLWMKQVMTDFRELGYDCSYRLLNAADFGVASIRERVFIVGVKIGMEFEHPRRAVPVWTSSKKAIGDLDSMLPNEEIHHVWRPLKFYPGYTRSQSKLNPNRPGPTMIGRGGGNSPPPLPSTPPVVIAGASQIAIVS